MLKRLSKPGLILKVKTAQEKKYRPSEFAFTVQEKEEFKKATHATTSETQVLVFGPTRSY